jgi:hypothetical protein
MAVVGQGPNSPYSTKAPSIVREELMAIWNKEAAEQKAASKSSASSKSATTTSSASASKPASSAAASPASSAGGKSAPPKGGKASSAASAEAEAKRKAQIDFDAGELPPGWNWEETDDGEIYFTQPDDETTWDDPRDDFEKFWIWYK